MARIRVVREHRMSLEAAQALAERFAAEIAEEFDIEYGWNGGRLEFRRPGAQGHVEIDEHEVRIQMYLEMLLMPLRSRIKTALEEELDKLLFLRENQ